MNKKGIIIFIIGILIVTIFIFALNQNEKNVVSESTSFEEATTTSLIHSPIENEITGVGTHLLEEFEAREEHLATVSGASCRLRVGFPYHAFKLLRI